VRKIAREQKLASAEKKDSQGICFVGKVHLPDFLQQKLASREGNIFEIPADSEKYSKKREMTLEEHSRPINYKIGDGVFAGKHQGAHFFTIGQRKGLKIGGKKEPLFVIATDVDKNRLFVGQGKEHPGLYRKGLFIKTEELHWIRPDLRMKIGERRDYRARIRYRQSLENASLEMRREGMYILFENPQRGIAAGQFAAWYDDGELLGSGVIDQ